MRTSESTMDIYGNHCNQIYQLKLSTKVAEKLCQAMSHLVWIRNFPKMCGMEHVWEGMVVGRSILIISSSNSKIPIGRSFRAWVGIHTMANIDLSQIWNDDSAFLLDAVLHSWYFKRCLFAFIVTHSLNQASIYKAQVLKTSSSRHDF